MTIENLISVDHPGTFLEEELEARGWTQMDLAYILGWKPQTLNKIIKGAVNITADTAQAFGEAFDMPPEFFSNLQKMYDLKQLPPPDGSVRTRARWAEHFPVRKMIERKWISDSDPDLLDAQMLRFFECKSMDDVPFIGGAEVLSYAAKKRDYSETTPLQFLWLHRVRQIAETFEAPDFNPDLLRQILPEIRRHMLQRSDLSKIPHMLRKCGVRFVLVEALPSASIDGVCLWLDDRPVIAMTTLHDRMDNFCFVLMHELAHVLNGDGREKGYSAIDSAETTLDQSSSDIAEQERVANTTAAHFLIPADKLESFYDRKAPFISERDVLAFAARHEIHPAIAVGQIHRISGEYNKLRKHLKKVREYLVEWEFTDGWGKVVEVQL